MGDVCVGHSLCVCCTYSVVKAWTLESDRTTFDEMEQEISENPSSRAQILKKQVLRLTDIAATSSVSMCFNEYVGPASGC